MEKINDNKIKYYNYLWELGHALFSYYSSEQILSQEQIELIANSSNDDKLEAMEYVSLNNGFRYNRNMFCRNTASINRVKRMKKGKND